MRSHKFFTVFILGFITIAITIVFIFWGIGPQQNTSEVIVATVNNNRLTLAEYERAYEIAYRRARDFYEDIKEIENLDLRKSVFNELLNNMVLLEAVKNAGITITENELQEVIFNEPAFYRDGVFDKEVYLRRLSLNRLTPRKFEAELKRDLLLDKMRRLIGETSELAGQEEKILASISGETAEIYEKFLISKRQMAISSYIHALKRRMKISINDKYNF